MKIFAWTFLNARLTHLALYLTLSLAACTKTAPKPTPAPVALPTAGDGSTAAPNTQTDGSKPAPKPAQQNSTVQINGSLNSPGDTQTTKINAGRDGTSGVPATGGAGPAATPATGTPNPSSSIPAASSATGKSVTYSPVPAGYSLATVQQWVAAHQSSNQGFKYLYIAPQQAQDKDQMNILRVAMGKAWNHLSKLPDIDVPIDISGGAGLAFALNATKVWGADTETNWRYIANCTPKGNISISPAQGADQGACKPFSASQPVEVANFVFNAVNGGPYANIWATPPDFGAFQNKFQLGDLKAVATVHDAIVCGPRIIGYRSTTINGVASVYAFTSDEFDGRDQGDINYTQAPTDNDQRQTGAFNAGPGDGDTAIASEWWLQLPNGFLYWGIHGEGAQERGKAEFPFAVDPANWAQNNDLAVARSCITCHAAGIQSSHSDDKYAGKNGWTTNADLSAYYTPVRNKFQNAMTTLVNALSDGSGDLNTHLINGTTEPIAKAILLMEGAYQSGNNDGCNSFCNGKFSAQRNHNLCDSLPTTSLTK